MDINLNDPQAIRQAIKEFIDAEKTNLLPGSIIETICQNDPTRRDTFVEIGFFPTLKLIQFDFNFRTSIERAFLNNSVKALKTLIDEFFDKINTHEDYYPLIMTDLCALLENKQVDIE